jgi:hypothetical protein
MGIPGFSAQLGGAEIRIQVAAVEAGERLIAHHVAAGDGAGGAVMRVLEHRLCQRGWSSQGGSLEKSCIPSRQTHPKLSPLPLPADTGS